MNVLTGERALQTEKSEQTEKREAWHALEVQCRATAQEAVEYGLMEAGALGTETLEQTTNGAEHSNLAVTVKAYFDNAPEQAQVETHVAEALRIYNLDQSSIETVHASETPAQDWLAEWKRNWKPVAVGRKFLIAPTWSEVEASERAVVRIDPGMAFGTGTHETTRLCLELLEDIAPCRSFFDVGTGTGILAIACAILDEHAHIVACDTDADAIKIAGENAGLNGVAERIEFRVGTVERPDETYETVCANLTADAIVPLLPSLVQVTEKHLLLSGILATQEKQVREALAAHTIRETKIRKDGEWIAIYAIV